jgi:transcriptional antiterminator RfaH
MAAPDPAIPAAQAEAEAAVDGGWFLVHAKTGRELVAQANLQRQGYRTFLPLERRTVRHARRIRETFAAYFPGYLFVALDLSRQAWRPINSTLGVLRLVAAPDGPTPAPAALMRTLRSASDAQGVMTLQREWEPGAAVRIASGPFADQLGVVEGLGGADRVRVLLSIMQGEVRIVTPAHTLRKAS